MIRPRRVSYPRSLALDICEAIAAQRLLTFDYLGFRRIVQPYCHGFTNTGEETLRAIEINGRGRPFGKLWTVTKMANLQLADDNFAPNDPNYNPADSAMAEIHCCVTPPSTTRPRRG
ncbi:MAG TPA: hypothetical protein VN903_18440 [Polyangia bacterium]|jgi:hypothetical protein|nr:hypothetical protein [Polyangia bacterium]